MWHTDTNGSSGNTSFAFLAHAFQHSPWPRSLSKVQAAAWHSSWIRVQRKRSAFISTFLLKSMRRILFPPDLKQQYDAALLDYSAKTDFYLIYLDVLRIRRKCPAMGMSFFLHIISTLSLLWNIRSLYNLYKIDVSSFLWALKFWWNFFASGWQRSIDIWAGKQKRQITLVIPF